MDSSSTSRNRNLGFILVSMLLGIVFRGDVLSRPQLENSGTRIEDPWRPDQLVKSEELSKRLPMKASGKFLILHVGFPSLYRNAHIQGSKFVGSASTPEGIETLRAEVHGLPSDAEIILYCGCCPWNDCPNIRPAFRTLSELGFKKIKVLYLPQNLLRDWIERGLPVERRVDAADHE